MIEALFAVVGGYLVFGLAVTIALWRSPLRGFWLVRVGVAALMGLVLWKISPLWTRWETVFDHPVLLLTMTGGLAGLVGGFFAFGGVAFLSYLQIRREGHTAPRGRLWGPVVLGVVVYAILGLTPLVTVRAAPQVVDLGPIFVPDLDGHEHALSDEYGHGVVLNFWASTCVSCLAEQPDLASFDRQPFDGATLIGVNVSDAEPEGVEGVRAFVKKHHLNWKQWTDPAQALQKAFTVTTLPTTIVLDARGRVVDRHDGPVDWLWLRTLILRLGP